MSLLGNLLDSLGGSSEQDRPCTPMDTATWIAHATDRPAWECWGKARPSGGCPAHPLLCHLLDVAAVAALLITEHISPAARARLLRAVPGDELAAFQLLLFVIALHDIGKYTPAFQGKVEWAKAALAERGFDLNAPEGARHHGVAGLGFARETLVALNVPRRTALALARAVTAHHGAFPTDRSLTDPRMGPHERGQSARWDAARRDASNELREFFKVARVGRLAIDHADVVALAGLTSVADWIGSMEEVFTYEPPQPSLAAYWPLAISRARAAVRRVGMARGALATSKPFAELFPGLAPWPLHGVIGELATRLDRPTLLVIEAPMGEGKTEAALLLANAASARVGHHGLFIGLPTRATANQMLGRVRRFLERTRSDTSTNLILAHGDADIVDSFRALVAVYDGGAKHGSGVRAEGWFLSKKRTLLAEYAIGTVDQALLGVMRAPHAFVRLWGLAGKVVVLDEVHAYDTYTSSIIERLVEWLAALHVTVILLSATLPSGRRMALAKAWRRGLGVPPTEPPPASYPRVTVIDAERAEAHHVTPRGSSVAVSISRVDDDIEAIARSVVAEVSRGGCVGWICNTVNRAQAAAVALRTLAPDVPRVLLHARMLPEERARREATLESWLGPERDGVTRPERCIVIGTQVLEQSLDVDFDLMVSDLAPVDLVLQRAGRLHRHRGRSNRASAHPTPRLWIVHAPGPYDRIPVREVAMVYAEALVRGTVRALAGRDRITLPDDIEPLVETVYRAAPPPASDALFGEYVAHFGSSMAQRQDAENRLLPRPADEDDIFADLRMPFDDDDDPRVHQDLRAATRDGDESVQVVCLVGRGGRVHVDETDAAPLDLGVTPDRATAARLARRTIGVSRPSLVRSLLDEPSYSPSAWSESAVLRHRRALVFTDGAVTVGDTRLELDPELGLTFHPNKPRSGA